MRKLVSLLLALVTVFAVTATASASSAIRVQLDGSEITFDEAPFVENGRTLVPVRALSEALGFTVGWDEAEQRISLTKGDTSISLWVDSPRVVVNGKESKLDVPVRKVGNRTFIPLRFVSETMGTHVGWNQDTQTATVTSAKSLSAILAKGSSQPLDLKAEGTFDILMTMKGAGIPGAGMTIPMQMNLSFHTYKNEMLGKMSMQPPFGPAIVQEMAVRGGKTFSRTAPGTTWTQTGTADANSSDMLSKQLGMQGLDASVLQGKFMDSIDIRVAGATEIDGVKVLQVTIDLSKSGLDGMVNELFSSMGGVGGGSGDLDMKMSLERYLISLFVAPETGFLHRADVDLAMTMNFKDATGGGTMDITLKGSLNSKPVSEPIQFPTDLLEISR